MKNKSLFLIAFCLFYHQLSLAQNTYTYTLIDADNNTALISSFNTDVTWNIDNSGGLNLISDLSVYGVADKVRFITTENTRTEGAIPYAYYGDASGAYGQQGPTYYGWFPTVGSLYFTVEYLDVNLNVITTDTFTITFIDNNTSSPDTEAPMAPTLSSTGETETTADLFWSGATDNVAVTDYNIYKDGVFEVNVSGSLHTVTGLTSSTTYSFTVTALDAAGNESVASNAILVTTDSSTDTQVPTVPTLSSNGETETTANLSWSGATDNVGVTGYKIFKDGALEATLGNVSSHTVTGLTASTTYSFTVTALDAAGNESVASNIVQVTTDSSGGSSGGGTVWSESSGNISYSAGNVGIGTSTIPNTYKLAVNGKIISEELKVQLQSAWPDYVFAKDYDLPSLEEVGKYIQKKGHLPNMPPAKEVKENGIEVGEMNRLLLEKIEELTLYILQQEERLKSLENKIDNK
ncbi:fibronectin type III domain-containing protein [Flagellimonas eckloniae]|uniref:fibronectin type III domain-containing protein n=1 Tax=Flagellimonas eckloniae TaxID=346185 RepID=UPI0006DCEA0E|nr:fibronectin type III domain-containing protein [Allomuricauda eckloniae]